MLFYAPGAARVSLDYADVMWRSLARYQSRRSVQQLAPTEEKVIKLLRDPRAFPGPPRAGQRSKCSGRKMTHSEVSCTLAHTPLITALMGNT